MADILAIAKQFTSFYYAYFDQKDFTALKGLYRDGSMLTFEDAQIMGVEPIIEKLGTLPFQKIEHKILTQDAQPASSVVASMIVLVTGQLIVDGGEVPIHFCQIFHLIPDGTTYYVQNDIFRLNYG